LTKLHNTENQIKSGYNSNTAQAKSIHTIMHQDQYFAIISFSKVHQDSTLKVIMLKSILLIFLPKAISFVLVQDWNLIHIEKINKHLFKKKNLRIQIKLINLTKAIISSDRWLGFWQKLKNFDPPQSQKIFCLKKNTVL